MDPEQVVTADVFGLTPLATSGPSVEIEAFLKSDLEEHQYSKYALYHNIIELEEEAAVNISACHVLNTTDLMFMVNDANSDGELHQDHIANQPFLRLR